MFDLKPELVKKREAGLYRERRLNTSAQGVYGVIDGKRVLSFCGNDYLGLANHVDVKQAFVDAVSSYGVGSGSAHLINGHSQLHHECEQRLAEFTGRDRALLFSNGYMANLAIASALLGRRDIVYQDRLNHASLIDGAKLSGARLIRYRHNDVKHLQTLLTKSASAPRSMLMTDGVFSMDGDCADLVEISALCASHDTCCMVDDAHGFGVLGENGGGLLQSLHLDQHQVPILMATLGKAIGTSGAFVAGSNDLIETLIQQARPYIYTTASPPAISAATLCSLDLVERESWRRHKLAELIEYLRQGLSRLGFELTDSNTPIQPIIVGDNIRALALSDGLFEQGILVSAIRPPTVPQGSARLRITLSAAHEKADIDRLLSALKKIKFLASC
ncbi:MAG: 8-amino-7-oxononanoate synthase [Gammaproteobacteria bacterium]|nr:8-amino-7-oxononanoate synthase [Gammaproteobacteria bacterium]